VDPDLFLVIGLAVALLSVPALISAFSESRAPRAAAIMLMIAAGLVSIAVLQKPGGYEVGDLPNVVMGVVSGIVR
jgi:hypothetical protein